MRLADTCVHIAGALYFIAALDYWFGHGLKAYSLAFLSYSIANIMLALAPK